MRSPSARLVPNSVTVYPIVKGRDAAGGKTTVRGTGVVWPNTSVQSKGGSRTTVHGVEQFVTAYEVLFRSDPGCTVNDEIDWAGGTLIVLSTSNNQAGQGALFVVQAEQRG